ncbi:hypothetical protein [Massilia sp. Leaf139]|uniref:hypothetical protein n=1 Tax=Massilia sp. Leaf139 TaxID=1736272 RepID=UPI0006F40DDA|nr:hypothetical protein [Massilia sp. Leaf139]KQQ96596.1 hypothetical protein ASF77_00915 [Massilia sp. Leaf139]
MNSPKLPTLRPGALDALCDDIEHALLDLTTASLDDEDGLPAPTVDEFALEFLIESKHPPCPGGTERSTGY